jgi:hypothetical protein
MNTMLTAIFETEFFKNLLAAVALALGTALSTLIGMLFKRLTDWVAEKAKGQKYKRTLETIETSIRSAVLMVQQTFVDNLKKEGKFDSEAQAKALELAVKTAASQINDEMKKVIEELFGDIEEWLKTQIEAFIAYLK